MKKRILSLFLAALMVLTLVPFTGVTALRANADTKIYGTTIRYAVPSIGKKAGDITFTNSMASSMDCTMTWYKFITPFKKGAMMDKTEFGEGQYEVEFTLKPKAGYFFDDKFTMAIDAGVNYKLPEGHKINIDVENQKITVTGKFILSSTVSLVRLSPGKTPMAYSEASSSPYALDAYGNNISADNTEIPMLVINPTNSFWYEGEYKDAPTPMEKTAKFEKGKTYTYRFSVSTRSGYSFADDVAFECEIPANVTIKSRKLGASISTYYVDFTFGKALPAASGTMAGGISWTFNRETGALRFSGSGPLPDYTDVSDENVFCEQPAIKTVIIEDGITLIGGYLFSGCYNLKDVYIASSVKTIKKAAFMDCTALQNVVMGDGVTNIYSYAFHNTDLMNVYCAGDEDWITTGVNVSDSYNDPLLDPGLNIVTDCDIGKCGDTVFFAFDPFSKRIVFLGAGETDPFDDDMNPNDAFRSADIKEAFIGARITNTTGYIFNDCENLTEIRVDPENTNFEAFNKALYTAGQKALVAFPAGSTDAALSLPTTVTEIYDGAVNDAGNLKTVTIPKSLKTVGYGAFENCDHLEDVYYYGNKTEWGEIDIGDANEPLVNAAIHYTIDRLALTIAAPQIGKTPQTTYIMLKPEAAVSPIKVTGIKWSPADETFAAGKAYTVTITVQAKDAYTLPRDASLIDATINGNKAKYEWHSVHDLHLGNITYAEISYTFPTLTDASFYVITVENGTASANAAKAGVTITITADEPPKNKVFDGWEVVSGAVTLADPKAKTTTFTMPADSVALAARYKDVTVGPVTPEVILGDVDGSGKVDTSDARLALRQSIGLEKYAEDSREFKACDVDKNGKVETKDARFILRHAIGLKDPEIIWE